MSSIDFINKNKQCLQNNFFKLSEKKIKKIHLIKNQRNQSLYNKSSFTDLNSRYSSKICRKITPHFINKNPSSSLIIQNSRMIKMSNSINIKSAHFTKILNMKQNIRHPSIELSANQKRNKNQINVIKNKDSNNINLIFNNFNLSTKKIDSKKRKDNNNDAMYLINKIQVANIGFKNTLSSNLSSKNRQELDDLKKKNEKINILYNEKIKENKIINMKIIEYKNDNLQLRKKIYKLNKENQEFIKIFEKIQKFVKILKNNGINVDEIMDNISSNREKSCNSESTSKGKCENISDSIPIDNFKCHETFKGSKLIIKENSIPKLNIKRIKRNNNNKNNNKDNNNEVIDNENTKNDFNKNKRMSHSAEK